MKFGPVATEEAEGAFLAHSLQKGRLRLAKGSCIGADDVAALLVAGVASVTVARLEPGDVGEDEAAGLLASALVPDPVSAGLILSPPHAGRVNLHARAPGIVEMDVAAIHALNLTDSALTLAVLPPFARVEKGTLVATVKVISYGVAKSVLDAAADAAGSALRVRPVRYRSAALLLTATGNRSDDKLADKARRAVATRLDALEMTLKEVRIVPHEAGAIAAALPELTGEMVLILTGAATSDLYDTAPEALRQAGGRVARFGIPVDPGNLLFYGHIGARPVIGLPGCARSPALNGADWVLERLACGLTLSDQDVAAMGVGGLLKEIALRPQPREGSVA